MNQDLLGIELSLSRRQMLGVACCSVLALSLPACTDKGADSPQTATPGFLDRVVDLLIPETDTPGAKASGASAFVEKALASGLFAGSASTIGIVESTLNERSNGRAFMRESAKRQGMLLADFDEYAFANPRPADAAAQAWRSAKQAIVFAYYTSEPGASVELRYELVPGRYDPDIPLKSGQAYLSNNWMANLG